MQSVAGPRPSVRAIAAGLASMAADGSMASLDALCRPLLERLSELGVQVSSSDARVLVLTALVWCGLHITGRRKKMASEHITQSVPPTDCGEALEEDEELFFAESAKVWAQIEAERAGCIPLAQLFATPMAEPHAEHVPSATLPDEVHDAVAKPDHTFSSGVAGPAGCAGLAAEPGADSKGLNGPNGKAEDAVVGPRVSINHADSRVSEPSPSAEHTREGQCSVPTCDISSTLSSADTALSTPTKGRANSPVQLSFSERPAEKAAHVSPPFLVWSDEDRKACGVTAASGSPDKDRNVDLGALEDRILLLAKQALQSNPPGTAGSCGPSAATPIPQTARQTAWTSPQQTLGAQAEHSTRVPDDDHARRDMNDQTAVLECVSQFVIGTLQQAMCEGVDMAITPSMGGSSVSGSVCGSVCGSSVAGSDVGTMRQVKQVLEQSGAGTRGNLFDAEGDGDEDEDEDEDIDADSGNVHVSSAVSRRQSAEFNLPFLRYSSRSPQRPHVTPDTHLDSFPGPSMETLTRNPGCTMENSTLQPALIPAQGLKEEACAAQCDDNSNNDSSAEQLTHKADSLSTELDVDSRLSAHEKRLSQEHFLLEQDFLRQVLQGGTQDLETVMLNGADAGDDFLFV